MVIIIIIVVVVVVYFLVIKQGTGGNKSKREIVGLVSGVFNGARSVDPELSKQMARIMRERMHFPQQLSN